MNVTSKKKNQVKVRMGKSRAVLLLCACCGIFFSSCGGDHDSKNENVGVDTNASVERGKELENFTGSHTRAVWVQQQKSGQIDKHAAGGNLKLLGLDSLDGRGERVLLEKVGSYSRPLFTPDGNRVVFSNKGVKKSNAGIRSYSSKCFVLNFDGSGLKDLGVGYAEALWNDPAGGDIWILASVGFKDDERVVMEGKKLVKFKLDAPEKREVVWNKTPVGADSFRMGRDGQKMVGQFPWPESGIVDLKTGFLQRTGNGCWTSMAPDDSGISWVFDGAHQNVSIYDRNGRILNTLAINTHPDLKGKRVYHPRWTNHPQFGVVSGPYIQDKKAGADRIDIYLARFAPDMSKVEEWHRITDNNRADLYADVWIQGGEDASLTVQEGQAVAVAPVKWPPASKHLFFAWKNNRESVELNGKISRLRAEGAARFGKRFDLAPGNGLFHAEGIDAKMIDANQWLNIDAVITPARKGGTIMEFGSYRFSQHDEEFRVTIRGDGSERSIRFGKPVAGRPVSIRLEFDPEVFAAFINGKAAEIWTSPLVNSSEWQDAGIIFGGDWDGRIERIAFYGGKGEGRGPQLSLPQVIEPDTAAERIKVRAKLLEMTPQPVVEDLGAYTRALVYHLYEIDEILEGKSDAKRMIVAHWSLLDRQPASGVPSDLGAFYHLEVEPLRSNPQLKSERTFDDTTDLDAPIYFDMQTPSIQDSKSP